MLSRLTASLDALLLLLSPATWLCASAALVSVGEGAGVASPPPAPAAGELLVTEDKDAKLADTAGSPDATSVTPGPGALVVLAATSASCVRVAESMTGAGAEDCASAVGTPGGGDPPAITVTPDARVAVARVVGEPIEPIDPVWSWNGGGGGGFMGKEPAGHTH